MKRILVTGGAGFIGSALIRYIIQTQEDVVVNLDKLTYAGSLDRLEGLESSPRYFFEKVDISDHSKIELIFNQYQPQAVINLAAETHVDRSIDKPSDFIWTNIIGTHTLLEVSTRYWQSLSAPEQKAFRFIQVSTDEVFGDIEQARRLSKEGDAYRPSSPYAASKASADHLVMAWHRTYGLPAIVTYCSNNYGLFQFPEKLIPLMILNALEGKPLPVYGDGEQVRDWIYVEDHVRALSLILQKGRVGEQYNISANQQIKNIELINLLCARLEQIVGGGRNYGKLITFVPDRPGHDRCYGLDSSKIRSELGWQTAETLESGITKTIKWYLANQHRYSNYSRSRLGLGGLV